MSHHEYDECDLPGDLIWEILARLPVRLLLQLRTVCRSWNSLISSHEFVMHHLQCSTQPRLIYCNSESEGNDFMHCSVPSLLHDQLQPTRFESLHMQYKSIHGSCNGLLCFCEGSPYKTLTLFNPCTRSVSLTVPLEYPENPHGEHRQPVFCGLGYDSLRDKYKFVTGSKSSPITAGVLRCRAKVCTLDANPSWKTVDHPVFPYYTWCHSGTFVSGTLNWMAHDPSKSEFLLPLEWFILIFELETESFGQLCLPRNNHTDTGYAPSLQVLKNFLSVSFQSSRRADNTTAFVIWIMKEYGIEKSWTVLFTVPTFSRDIWLEPLYISEDDILLAYREYYRCKFLVYNFRKGEVVYRYPMVDGLGEGLSAFSLSKTGGGRHFLVFYESLISPPSRQFLSKDRKACLSCINYSLRGI